MNELKIRILTFEKELFNSFNQSEFQKCIPKEQEENIHLKLSNLDKNKAIGLFETIEFVVTISGAVAINIFSNWLYDIIKDKVHSLSINKTKVQIDSEKIQETIKNEIVKNENIKGK